MKAKKLIEVAMPIKEISAESVRDKSIRHGHISTLHLWWARRPLPVCRAVVFGSLVPDPLDPNCPKAFLDAVKFYLVDDQWGKSLYKPYDDIPYTPVYDPVEDNLRNRLMMFIGKFSQSSQKNLKEGKTAIPKDLLSIGSLIKWENKNDQRVLRIARELIWVAYNSENNEETSFSELHNEFSIQYDAVFAAEEKLYSTLNRHLPSVEVSKMEDILANAIKSFQSKMPIVFDPFSGGGAIPLEAARLGCRSYGNDINPVAHVIERGSAEFPQKFGKPLRISVAEFEKKYGSVGKSILQKKEIYDFNGEYLIPNILSFDVEYYASLVYERTKKDVSHLFPNDEKGNTVIAYYWVRTAKCSNPSCNADVPLLKTFYLADSSSNKVYLSPIINGTDIQFELKTGKCNLKEWNHRGNITCPCCGNITNVEDVKKQSVKDGLNVRLVALISETKQGKKYSIPSKKYSLDPNIDISESIKPKEKLPTTYIQAFPCCTWGFEEWGELFSNRQLVVLSSLVKHIDEIKRALPESEYNNALITYLAFLVDKETDYFNSFCTWHVSRETIGHLFSRQAISMVFDYAETNIFSGSTGCFTNMIDWVIRYIESESKNPFSCVFCNATSGEKSQFKPKELTAVVTDPPYYDAIGYADCSDFFYSWLKHTIGDIYPINFSTPQTPKSEECTALKCHHNGDDNIARKHFEKKLTDIFDAIEVQTSDIVSIMYAHQSTEAWTTLCNSILDARMNITGSWTLDTEMSGGLKSEKAYLESSVTVACRPSERKGFGDYKDVKESVKHKVTNEVESLYALGFRGADLLTACFGQAVSEFGKYKVVEKSDGSEVTVAELLDMARTTAFNALLKGVQGDDFTRFYIGWLQMNGTGETDFDDATKFTRVGMQVDVSEIFSKRLLIRDGKKQHLATAQEHLGDSRVSGTRPEDSLIDQAHRAMLAYGSENRELLLKLLHDIGADDINSSFWRLLASLKELLPDGSNDLKYVEGLLGNSDNLRQEAKKSDQLEPTQLSFDF